MHVKYQSELKMELLFLLLYVQLGHLIQGFPI